MAAARILVKRYAESRFYDATHGRYLSRADLHAWSANGVAFRVVDAQTGEEIAPGFSRGGRVGE